MSERKRAAANDQLVMRMDNPEIEADRKRVAELIREYQAATEGDKNRREIIKKVREIFNA
jgi:hypothetical protein